MREASPLRGSGLFDHDGQFFAVFNVSRTREDAGLWVDGVAQRYINFARNIFQLQLDGLRGVLRGANKMKDQIAIAVDKVALRAGSVNKPAPQPAYSCGVVV